jgi:hypothetical protein
MSSSPEASPTSTAGGGKQFSTDKFSVDTSSPHLTLATNGNGHLNSPSSLKSPNGRRVAQFSREGILGSAQKTRNLSRTSPDRELMTNVVQNRQNSDDGTNPLKRRSTDAAIDYPRRRATIAVSNYPLQVSLQTDIETSVRYVVPENQDVMERNLSASCVLSLGPNVFIESLASNLMLATNLSWNI